MINGKILAAKVLFKNNIKSIKEMVEEWTEYGVDEAFTLEDLFLDPDYQSEIKRTDIKTWIIIQTFLNKEKIDSLYAIKSDGSKAIGTGNGSWLHMICPNGGPEYNEEDNYLKTLINNINSYILQYNPYGINLDFIRYFVFWEDVYENADPKSLPQTCFCKRCVNLFFKKLNQKQPNHLSSTPEISAFILENYEKEWVQFKCETITNAVHKIVESIKAVKPEIKFNIHGVPWKSSEFDNAIRRIAGQDYNSLAKYVDGISPMCYTGMLKRDSSWINDVVKEISNQTGIKILPAFQGVSMYGSSALNTNKFKDLIKASLKSPSSGVAFWPWEQISQKNKMVIKEI